MARFQCKHKYKSKVDMVIVDNVRISGFHEDTIYKLGEYSVWRCLECKCLVWDERKKEKEKHEQSKNQISRD